MQQFGDGIGQAARADVVHEADRIGRAQRDATIDHFLAASFHLGVVALHRGKIECLRALPGGDGRCRAAAEADQHRRTAQHDDRIAGAQRQLAHLLAIHRAQAAGKHDRLVVGTDQARLRGRQFETAEIAGQVGTAKFVVEGGAAERAVHHDLEGGGHARIELARLLPRLRQRRDAQVRHRKTGEADLGLAAPSGRALVADLATGAGAGARERGDRRRMIVRFDLDAERAVAQRLVMVFAGAGIGAETPAREAFDDRRVVLVGAERELRRLRMRVADHAEQGVRHVLAVDAVARVEYLVPAMFRICLGEHHQFGVGRIAAQRAIAFDQVGQFVFRQGQPEPGVGRSQFTERNALELACGLFFEQGGRIAAMGQQRLRHRVEQFMREARPACIVVCRQTGQVEAQTAFDALHAVAGALQDFGGLAGPGRDRAQARRDEPALRSGDGRRLRGTAFQDSTQGIEVRRRARFGLQEIDMPCAGDLEVGNDLAKTGLKTVAPKGRQGRQALEDDHVRGYPWKTSRLF